MPPATERPRAVRPRRAGPDAASFDFFFYGTLCDADMRAAVLGRGVSAVRARLENYEAVPVSRGRYPILLVRRGGAAPGVLCRGLGLVEAGRLGFYEHEGRDYVARKLTVQAEGAAGEGPRPAWVYLPVGALKRGPGRWDLDEWRRYAKRDFLARWTRALRAAEPRDLEPFIELWRGRAAPGA